MTIREATTILCEMQLWRRAEGKYDIDAPTLMPYSPKQFGEAIDIAIKLMKQHHVDLPYKKLDLFSSPTFSIYYRVS